MNFDLDKIVKRNKLTNLEQQVLEYVVNNIERVEDLGVRGVAKENFTSTSTIIRLSKKLGYKGFVDMSYKIRDLANKTADAVDRRAPDFEGIDFNHILSHTDEKAIEAFVDLLKNRENKALFIYATGFSKIVGEYLTKKLLVLGIKCMFSSGSDSYAIYENHLTDLKALIVISKSGETSVVMDKVESAKNMGIQVISFTNELDNSVSMASDIVFKIFDCHKLDDKSFYPNSFFPNICMLIEYIVWRYLQETKNS